MSGERISSVELRASESGLRHVVVRTDTGRSGVGELAPTRDLGFDGLSADSLTALLAGFDPVDVTAFIESANRSADQSIANPVTVAATAVAMLDLNAGRLGIPLSSLFAGPVRETIPVCAADWAPGVLDLGEATDAAQRTVAAGFTALRVDVAHIENPTARAALVATVRDAVPAETRLAVRGGGEAGTREAMVLIDELRPLDVLWFEQPTMVPTAASLRRLADRSLTALAAGRGCRPEHLDTLAAAGLVDHLVLEPNVVGGPHAARRLAALAEIHHTHMILAGSGGPVSLAVAVQLAAVIPNLTTLEVVPGQLVVTDGTVSVDQSAGLPHPGGLLEPDSALGGV